MRLPAFRAEASLYRLTDPYRNKKPARASDAAGHVLPQQPNGVNGPPWPFPLDPVCQWDPLTHQLICCSWSCSPVPGLV